jgi:hypothetical protein
MIIEALKLILGMLQLNQDFAWHRFHQVSLPDFYKLHESAPDHAQRRQREVDVDAQALTIEVVDDIEQTIAPAVGQTVMHEIHRPAFVDCRRNREWLWLLSGKPLLRLDSQIQLQLPINAVDTLMVPAEAFHVAQKQVTCSGQLIPDSGLGRFSAFAGGTPSLNACGLIQL